MVHGTWYIMEFDTRNRIFTMVLVGAVPSKTLCLHATLGVGRLWDSCTFYTEHLPTTHQFHIQSSHSTHKLTSTIYTPPTERLCPCPLSPPVSGHHHSESTACPQGCPQGSAFH